MIKTGARHEDTRPSLTSEWMGWMHLFLTPFPECHPNPQRMHIKQTRVSRRVHRGRQTGQEIRDSTDNPIVNPWIFFLPHVSPDLVQTTLGTAKAEGWGKRKGHMTNRCWDNNFSTPANPADQTTTNLSQTRERWVGAQASTTRAEERCPMSPAAWG